MLQGVIVKDDSGADEVFTEQGSSASQMTTAKAMDVIARFRDCAGQAADAVSADTQVKMEDAPRLLEIPKSECPDIWDVLNVNVKRMRASMSPKEKCSTHEFLLQQLKKLPGREKAHAKTVALLYDMEAHAQKCVERFCEWVNKKTKQSYQVSTPCLDDHNFKKEELEAVGELSNVCSHIVLKCLYLARIGRLDIL